MCAPERHPHPGKALHLPQLALLLRKPFWEGHQGRDPGGLRTADKKAQDGSAAAQWLGHHHQRQQKASLFLLQYIFVSLISRDSVYDVLRRVCTHLQVSSKKSLSLKELTEEPDAVSLVRVRAALGEGRTAMNSRCGQESIRLAPLEVIVPEGKWRKVSPASLSLSLPDADYQCIHRTSVSSLSAKESSFTSEEPLVSESAINTEEELEVEQSCVAELRPSDYQLLKIFIVLICLLVVSSSYLAFRIFRLEQQLCSLNRDYLSRGPRR
ncbi:PREDICTED: GRAM domain-containing protein 2 isoform X3 [Haliaeetus leucocephalus]|uniref:GRAM domain-containing protein 2 isoform X3 n=1 Tax=Haliaeetus leucocephalus TaxID=52644 RepID=UPI00053CC5B9|nr:PREDICTED: GRAM domain-containing protein 2 isoform X3 [Haliaeetus leucocephalus]